MRVLVVGGGLAGAALAWRLAADHRVERVGLVTGSPRRDASGTSGGVVRSFEPDPVQRRLATESLRELREDAVLRTWARYAEAASLYVTTGPVPGPARTLDAGELARRGWAGLPEGARGVHEPNAGWIDPGALRDALLADLRSRRNVQTTTRDLDAGHRPGAHDALVVAAGAWTASVLRRLGADPGGLRTKAIQYGVYRLQGVDGWRPPCFVDETTGLYGRPVGTGEVLLGVPTTAWDVSPDRTRPDPLLEVTALRLASRRLPGLRLGARSRLVASADCYHAQPYLALRPVRGRVLTFTGGSGGSAKTVLAASAQAGAELVSFLHSSRNLANGASR